VKINFNFLWKIPQSYYSIEKPREHSKKIRKGFTGVKSGKIEGEMQPLYGMKISIREQE
jgi:hypothetical protein